MEQNTTLNVWNEITISQSGVGITLYSESQEGGAIVEDETWYTFDELQESTGDIVSLNLSEETVDNLASRQSVDSQQFAEGDVLVDDNAPVWSENNHVVVTEVTDTAAKDHSVEVNEGLGDPVERSVATANPSYPADDTVILAKYTDGDEEYAFPESRLVEE